MMPTIDRAALLTVAVQIVHSEALSQQQRGNQDSYGLYCYGKGFYPHAMCEYYTRTFRNVIAYEARRTGSAEYRVDGRRLHMTLEAVLGFERTQLLPVLPIDLIWASYDAILLAAAAVDVL